MLTDTISQNRKKGLLSARATRQLKRVTLHAVLVVGGVGMCFPFFWMLLTSFKNYAEAIASPPTLFPSVWGPDLVILGATIRLFPLTLVIFIVWMALGYFIATRIRDKVIAGIYVVAHLALFFILGNLGWLDGHRLADYAIIAASRAKIQVTPFWDNYVQAWGRAPFGAYFQNSIIMSVLTPLLIVLTSAPAAYAFARLRFPGKDSIFLLYLATMMIPPEVLLIPNFVTISELGWKNTYFALIVPFSVNVVTIFFLRQFFRSLPNELFDAAVMDGAGHLRFLISVAIPLSRPALVSTAMLNFLGTWNALIWPLLVTDKATMRPVTLGLASFATEAGTQFQLYMAAATFSTVPVIVLFLFVQKQFIEGIARTGIK